MNSSDGSVSEKKESDAAQVGVSGAAVVKATANRYFIVVLGAWSQVRRGKRNGIECSFEPRVNLKEERCYRGMVETRPCCPVQVSSHSVSALLSYTVHTQPEPLHHRSWNVSTKLELEHFKGFKT